MAGYLESSRDRVLILQRDIFDIISSGLIDSWHYIERVHFWKVEMYTDVSLFKGANPFRFDNRIMEHWHSFDMSSHINAIQHDLSPLSFFPV